MPQTLAPRVPNNPNPGPHLDDSTMQSVSKKQNSFCDLSTWKLLLFLQGSVFHEFTQFYVEKKWQTILYVEKAWHFEIMERS